MKRFVLAVAVFAALGLSACKDSIATGLPEISAKDILTGNKITLSDYTNKVVFVNFFASWCHYCELEAPSLEELQDDYPDDLMIIGIALGDADPHDVELFSRDTGATYPMLWGTDQMAAGFGGVTGLPTTFVIANGEIVETIVGYRDYDGFETILLRYR